MGSPPFSLGSNPASRARPEAPGAAHPAAGRVAAIIPARFASTRFPGKVLAEVHGWPLLRYVWERARVIAGVDVVIIATDDDRVEEAAHGFGAEVARTAAHHASGTDRVGEVAQALEPPASFVLNLQGDEPLLPVRAIERMIREMRGRPDAIWTLAHPVDSPEEWSRPSVVKVVSDREGRALYFSRAPIPHTRADSASTGTGGWRHIGVYGFPAPLLRAFLAAPPAPLEQREGLEQLRALEEGLKIRVARAETGSPGVDVPEDLQRLIMRYPTRQSILEAGLASGPQAASVETQGGS